MKQATKFKFKSKFENMQSYKFCTVVVFLFFIIAVKAQYKNIRVDTSGTTNAEEVSIALNTIHPDYLAAGANISYFFNSFDSGLSWSQSNITSTFGVWGDPCLIYDGLDNLYFVHLSAGSSPSYWLDRIVVQKSTDNGITWSNGAGVGYNPPKQQDKPWIGVDLASKKYKNNLYLAWTQFDKYGSTSPKDSSIILFSRSTDQGEKWSAPIRVSSRAGNCMDSDSTVEGAVPCVGPNGEVYLSWAGPLGIMFDKSTDGGVSFGQNKFVTSQPGGWDFNVPGIYRCNGLPETACDTSYSIYRGNIYILWSDQRNDTTNTDVFIIKSTDGGDTWGKILKVNNDNTNSQQFFPSIAIDQTTGFIYVVFYDRRKTTGNATDVYLAMSTDGGNSFENFLISDSSFTPNAFVFFGDYIDIAAYNKKIYPIWMRMDKGLLSIWTAPINDSDLPTLVSENFPVVNNNFRLFQNYPNPFNPFTLIKFNLSKPGLTSLKVYDILGRLIATLQNGYLSKGVHTIIFPNDKSYKFLPSGMYFYKLMSGDYSETKKMIFLK